MKKIFSTGYNDGSFNIAALLLRTTFSAMLFVNHGIGKLNKFSELQHTFSDPLHVGHRWSLVLTLIAEVACTALLAFGLFSRLAAFVLTINFAVIVFIIQKGQPIDKMELAVVYFAAFFASLLIGRENTV